MKRLSVLLTVFLAGCANEVIVEDGDSSGSGGASDPCADRDEDACAPKDQMGLAECRRLYEGASCEDDQDYLGCVASSKFDCKASSDCASGETCETITSPICPVVPGLASCLVCGSHETHVCVE